MRIPSSPGSSGNNSDFEELSSSLSSDSSDDMPSNNKLIQKFRSSTGEPLASITAKVDASGEAYIPWQHIENTFHNVQCVRVDGADVEIMAHPDSKDDPSRSRIKCFPNKTLEVVKNTLIEAYNEVIVSCSEAQKETSTFLAENVKDLAAGFGAITLNEFTKDYPQREQAKDKVEKVLDDQKQALDRLAVIQRRVQVVASKTYELYEDPVPRLFVVLPQGSEPLDTADPSKNAFRLYFLCECDRHVTEGSKSGSDCIHFANHKGYGLLQPSEFFAKFGSHVLAVLELIKYGVVSEHMLVTPLSTFKVLEGIGESDINKDNIQLKLDSMIGYIKGQLGHDNDAIERSMLSSASDLHKVHTFLANPYPERSLGDLFRIADSNGNHGKWVCSSHYRQKYQPLTELLLDLIELNKGHVYEHQGKAVLSCNYMATATQVCSALQENPSIYEFDLTLRWDAPKNDIQGICDALKPSKVSVLRLDGADLQSVTTDGRFDPIIGLLSNGHLQEFSFRGCNWFIDGISDIGCPSIMSLRKLHLGLKPLEDPSKQRFFQLLQRLPNLVHLSLYSGDDVNLYDLVHDQLGHLPQLETITLSIPNEKDKKVVLNLKSNTAHCNRIVPQMTNIIKRRETLEKIVMPFRDDMRHNAINLLLELKAIDAAYNRQKNLKIELVGDGSTSVAEVEFRDPAQSYPDAPSDKHYRGLNSDMYMFWNNHEPLGFNDEPSKNLTVSDDSVVSFTINDMEIDDIRKIPIRLAAKAPKSIKIICNEYSGVKEWFAACALAGLSWNDLSRLELHGGQIVQFIEDLVRVFNEGATPSLQEFEIFDESSSTDLSGSATSWIKSMMAKGLRTLILRGARPQGSAGWNDLIPSINFSNLKTIDLTRSSIEQPQAVTLLNAIPEDAPLRSLKLHGIAWVKTLSTNDSEAFRTTNCKNANVKILF